MMNRLESEMYRTSVTELRLKFPGAPGLLFEDLTFDVPAGQKVLLLGPSGCGKSTLLQVLSGLIPRAVDVPMKCESIAVPDSWGYLFQDPDTQFCMPYVDEEIAFVLENLSVSREAMPAMIQSCLEQVGLTLEQPHVPIATLSGGMKQRLAIASLLALKPDVWFLDEPTSLLDPEGTRHVWETVKRVTRDKTVLIVEHKIDEIVDFVDRVVLFDNEGRIIADGLPERVFREHRSQLQQFGIWYPGVWDDFDAVRRDRGDERPLPDAARAAEGEPLVRLRDFAGYHLKEQRVALREADVYEGEWIAVIGANGAGKSTLLSSLMQLLPTTGDYRLAGRPVRRFADLAGGAAYVFQNPEMQFVAHTVYDELAFNFRRGGEPEDAVQDKTEALLRRFGLEVQRANHPYQLSLGQKRRLSVAAAATEGERLLLLDEPTFGQDAASTFALLEMLEAWRKQGTAIVMVTHDPEIVRRFATRVWEIAQGERVREWDASAYEAAWLAHAGSSPARS